LKILLKRLLIKKETTKGKQTLNRTVHVGV